MMFRVRLAMRGGIGLLAAALAIAASAQSQTPTPSTDATMPPRTEPLRAYYLGAGDVIAISVANHVEISGPETVPVGGMMVIPRVGTVKAEGMTLTQLTAVIKKSLDRQLVDPVVTVALVTARVQQISVVGDVQKPGVIPLLPNMKFADALSAAGGLIALSGVNGVITSIKPTDCDFSLIPRQGPVQAYSLPLVLKGDPDNNVYLRDGDVLKVDAGTFNVTFSGQVKAPGLHLLTRGLDLIGALAQAGGAADMGAISKVRVSHPDGTDDVVDLTPALVRGEPMKLPKLQNNDVVNVPLSTQQIAILGYVADPGVYPYPEGKSLTLSDAMGLAHGHDIAHRARWSKIGLMRSVNGKDARYIIDFGKFVTLGDSRQNPVLKPGDIIYVPETNQINLTTLFPAITSVALFWSAVK